MFVPTFTIIPQITYPKLQPLLTCLWTCYVLSHLCALERVPPPSLRVHIPLLYLEDSNSVNILVKSYIFPEALSHSLARSPPLCFYTKISITTPSVWSENFLLTPVFSVSRGHLQERSDQGPFVFISRLSSLEQYLTPV